MLPSSLLHFRHKKDDNNYSSHIDTIEDTLRALAILLPGRFEDADLCSQAILAGLNLVSLYHTKYLIKKSITQQLKTNQEISTSLFNERYVQLTSLKWTRIASWTLSIVSYTEVIFEMLLSRRVTKVTKWKWITGLEGFKVVLRLVLYYGAKKNMILHPTHFIRNVDPVTLEVSEEDKLELSTLDPRTGTALTYTVENDEKPLTSHQQSRWAQVGEILWIIRPLIYVLMITLEQRKNNSSSEDIKREKDAEEEKEEEDESIEKEEEGSWKPWLVSLGIDLISRIARHMQPMTNLEKDESKRRDYLFIYYLFRGPIYLKLTRLLLDKFCDATEHRPLISIITAAMNDYRPFWEDSYFYTAAS